MNRRRWNMQAVLAMVVLAACAANVKEMPNMAGDDDLEAQIRRLMDPLGGEVHVRERERASAWLLAHPDRAHPRLLAVLGTQRSPAIIHLLPRFGRAESIPVLAAILGEGDERLSPVAGEALARHPLPAAGEALLQALRSARSGTVVAAADGLAVRGDRAACGALGEAVRHRDPNVRYHAVQAGTRLGCIDRKELQKMAKEDPDPDLRDLAARLLAGG